MRQSILPSGEMISGDIEMGMRGTDHRVIEDLIDGNSSIDGDFWSKVHTMTGVVRYVPETSVALIAKNQQLTPIQNELLNNADATIEEYCEEIKNEVSFDNKLQEQSAEQMIDMYKEKFKVYLESSFNQQVLNTEDKKFLEDIDRVLSNKPDLSLKLQKIAIQEMKKSAVNNDLKKYLSKKEHSLNQDILNVDTTEKNQGIEVNLGKSNQLKENLIAHDELEL